MNRYFVAFVDYGNDFGIPEQRLSGPHDHDRAKDIKSDLEKAGGIGNTEVLEIDVDSESFPLKQTGSGY